MAIQLIKIIRWFSHSPWLSERNRFQMLTTRSGIVKYNLLIGYSSFTTLRGSLLNFLKIQTVSLPQLCHWFKSVFLCCRYLSSLVPLRRIRCSGLLAHSGLWFIALISSSLKTSLTASLWQWFLKLSYGSCSSTPSGLFTRSLEW